MSIPPLPTPTRKSSAKPLLILFVSAFVIVAIVTGSAWAFIDSRTSARLEKAVAKIRNADEPMGAQELDEWYTTDARAREAGDRYVELFASYMAGLEYDPNMLIVGPVDAPMPNEPIPPEVLEVTRRHLEINAQYLKTLRELTSTYPQVHFPIDFSQGMNIDLSHLKEVRRMTRMAALMAYVACEDHDGDAAVESIRLGIAAADTLHREPYIIGQLVRVACLRVMIDATARVINQVTLTDNQLDRLDQAWISVQVHGMMQYGLIGERALFYYDMSEFGFRSSDETLGFGAEGLAFVHQVPGFGFYYDIEILNLVDFLSVLIALGDEPTDQRIQKCDAESEVLESESYFGKFARNILVGALAVVYKPETELMAHVSCARQAIRICGWIRQFQKRPSELEWSEVIEMQDPFDGEDLKYRAFEDGFVVYSIGRDFEDNGGEIVQKWIGGSETKDLVFPVFDVSRYLIESDTIPN